jgi:hypothetical protein
MRQNPFPGMNPWLEWHWGDVHTSLTTYARDQLQPQLPPGLRARVEEYVAVESDEEWEDAGDRFSPDVRVVEQPGIAVSAGAAMAVADVTEPLVVPRKTEPATLHYIQIVDTKTGHRVVTSIEFLSHANKATKAGREQYREKQRTMLDGRVNLVEIDLLRSGVWVLAVEKKLAPKAYRQPYRVCVVRADRQHVAEIYPVSLRKPLPAIRIPLRSQDDDVRLELQTLLDATYVNGGYEDIDYARDPRPPLTGSDADWTDQLLREKSLR